MSTDYSSGAFYEDMKGGAVAAAKRAAMRHKKKVEGHVGKAEDHVHAVPAGTTGGAIEVKDDPSCGCAPQPSPPRSAAYDACLAEGAKLGPIKTPERVYQLVGATMSKQEQETLVVIPLDARYQLRGAPVEVHRGARSSVAVSTQEVLRTVIVSGASSFIMCHSHPSGRCSPSQADRDLTKHVDKACKTVGGECLMLDHVVIGRREYFYDSRGQAVQGQEHMKTKTITRTVSDLIAAKEEPPLPLSVIPNYMGINLCSVESLSWTEQEDGQLVDLTIHFIPATASEMTKRKKRKR